MKGDKLILIIFILFISFNGHCKKSIKTLHPEKTIIITNEEIAYPKFYFYYNQFKDFFVFGRKKAIYFVSKEGKLIKKYIVKNPQSPGGFESTLNMVFYPNFFFVVDYCKVIKFDYNCTFVGNTTKGLCLGMGLLWLSHNGQKIIYFAHKEGIVVLDQNKKIAINKNLKLKTPWEDTSMMGFFRFYQCVYDNNQNTLFAIHKGRYIIYKLNANSLKILKHKKVKPINFRIADDKKQGIYRMMGIEEYHKLLRGICEVQTVGIDEKYLYVRWGERIGHKSYLDVFDKNSLNLIREYKLADTYRETHRVACFGKGYLFEDDILERKENDIRLIKIYNIRKTLENDMRLK